MSSPWPPLPPLLMPLQRPPQHLDPDPACTILIPTQAHKMHVGFLRTLALMSQLASQHWCLLCPIELSFTTKYSSSIQNILSPPWPTRRRSILCWHPFPTTFMPADPLCWPFALPFHSYTHCHAHFYACSYDSIPVSCLLDWDNPHATKKRVANPNSKGQAWPGLSRFEPFGRYKVSMSAALWLWTLCPT